MPQGPICFLGMSHELKSKIIVLIYREKYSNFDALKVHNIPYFSLFRRVINTDTKITENQPQLYPPPWSHHVNEDIVKIFIVNTVNFPVVYYLSVLKRMLIFCVLQLEGIQSFDSPKCCFKILKIKLKKKSGGQGGSSPNLERLTWSGITFCCKQLENCMKCMELDNRQHRPVITERKQTNEYRPV